MFLIAFKITSYCLVSESQLKMFSFRIRSTGRFQCDCQIFWDFWCYSDFFNFNSND